MGNLKNWFVVLAALAGLAVMGVSVQGCESADNSEESKSR